MKDLTGLFANNVDSCYILTDRFSRRYFSGADIAEGVVMLSADSIIYFTDARYFSAAKPRLEKNGVKAVLFKDLSDIGAEIERRGITEIFADFDTATVREFEEYKTLAPVVSDGSDALKKICSVKTEYELENIRRACAITQKAFYKVLESVKVGVTENEIKSALLALYREYGAENESFDTIVAFGANSAVPHHETGNSVLKSGMAVLIDTGCVFNGYRSDFTRTFYFGKPVRKFTDSYDAVLRANELAISRITDGMRTDVADGIARKELEKRGLGKYFTHSLGHGLGLQIHEYPTLSPKRSDILENGSVFTIEPGVYFDGEFGIRIEDTVVLSHGKIERLYTDKKDLIIL